MSVECRFCGNKAHDSNCPKNPYCQGCKKGKGRGDHEAECIYAYTMPTTALLKESDIKKLEESIKNMRHSSPMIISDYEPAIYMVKNKPWGHERILHSDDTCVIKQLYVKAGHRLSLQYHNKKIESMFLVSGTGYIQLGDKEATSFRMNRLIPVLIEPGRVHRLMAAPDEDCLVVEISSTELDDLVRVEDDYGR